MTSKNMGYNMSMDEMNDPASLLKLLNCPVCLEVLQTPILMCQQGHNICQSCRNKMTASSKPTCPLCQSKFTTARNLLAEQLVEKLHRKCQFSKEGCLTSLAPKDWESHHQHCHFRQVTCDLMQRTVCKGTKCNYRNYFTHLQNVHGVQGIKGTVLNVTQFVTFDQSRLQMAMPREVWPMQYLDACNEIFLTGTAAVIGKIYWWVSVLGKDEDAAKYVAKVSLNLKNKGYETAWIGPVHSFRQSPESIIEQGLCLLLTPETLYPYTFMKMAQGNGGQHLAQQDNQPNIGWNVTFSVIKKDKLSPAKNQPSRPTLQVTSNERLSDQLATLKLDPSSPIHVKQEGRGSSSNINGNPPRGIIKIKEEALSPLPRRQTIVKSEPLSPSQQGQLTPKSKIKKGKSTNNLSG